MISEELENIGFQDYSPEAIPEEFKNFEIGRITHVHKNSYTLSDGVNEFYAEITGTMLYSSESELDLPVVGDFVFYQKVDEDFCIIQKILMRKNLLKRKKSGIEISFQPLAANIDVALLIQSIDRDFNLNRLERYLSLVDESSITPILLLSKIDLISGEELEDKISLIHQSHPDLKLIPFTNQEFNDDFYQYLTPQKTYILLGSSGVGKTTLLNHLMGSNQYLTGEISQKSKKGKHHTSSRYLVSLKNKAILIDTPGLRELALFENDSGIENAFSLITGLSEKCKFANCTHTNEPGCEVQKSLKNGSLDERMYQNYLKIQKENLYYNSSSLEKKEKDKKLGKLIKEVKSTKQRYK